MYLWEISIFSLNNVIVRPTKIMKRADKKQSALKIKVFIYKKVDLLLKYSSQKKNQKDLVDLWCRKMTLNVQILQTLRRLFIISVGLTMTWFSEKMLIFNMCRHGLMPNLIKKSWTVSTLKLQQNWISMAELQLAFEALSEQSSC